MNEEIKHDPEEQPIAVKKYTVTVKEYSNHINIARENDGFNALELMGMLERIQLEIIHQMRGDIKPEIVTRKVIKEESK